MAFLSGHHVVPTFTAVLVGAPVDGLSRCRRGDADCRMSAIFFAVWLLVSAVQVLPAIEYAKQSLRWAGAPEPLRWGRAGALRGARAILAAMEHRAGHRAAGDFAARQSARRASRRWGWHWRQSGGGAGNSLVRWFAALAAGGLLLALGGDFPLYWLIYRFVPMVEKAREPAMAIVLFQLGIAVLAALAITALAAMRGSAPLALVLILARPSTTRRAWRASTGRGRMRHGARQADIADFLRAQPGWFRVDFDDNDVPYNFGDLYGIEQFGGAVRSMPLRVHRMLGAQETPAHLRHPLPRRPPAIRPRAGGSLRIAQRTQGLARSADRRAHGHLAERPVRRRRPFPRHLAHPGALRDGRRPGVPGAGARRRQLVSRLALPASMACGVRYRNSTRCAPCRWMPARTASNSSTGRRRCIGALGLTLAGTASPRSSCSGPVVRST